MQRRKFSREFKIEAVRLIKERGVAVAQASRDLETQRSALRARRNAALEAARTLIHRIVINPCDEEGDPPQIDLTANLPALLHAGGAQLPPRASPTNWLDTAVKEDSGGKALRLAHYPSRSTTRC